MNDWHFPHLSPAGIHVHLKSQELSEEALALYYENVLLMAERLGRTEAMELSFVNLGSGIGIPGPSMTVSRRRACSLRAAGMRPGLRVSM